MAYIKNDGLEMESVPDLKAEVRASDAVVIVTNHKSYNYQAILADASLIIDTRNVLGQTGKNHPKVVRL